VQILIHLTLTLAFQGGTHIGSLWIRKLRHKNNMVFFPSLQTSEDLGDGYELERLVPAYNCHTLVCLSVLAEKQNQAFDLEP
jgi:hypothetical protein